MQPIKKTSNLKTIHSVTGKVKQQSKQTTSMVKMHKNIKYQIGLCFNHLRYISNTDKFFLRIYDFNFVPLMINLQ